MTLDLQPNPTLIPCAPFPLIMDASTHPEILTQVVVPGRWAGLIRPLQSVMITLAGGADRLPVRLQVAT